MLCIGVTSSGSAGAGDPTCSDSAGVDGAVEGLTTGDVPEGSGVDGIDLAGSARADD
jgi:hypothetical protein